MEDTFSLGDRTFRSRLIVGTGKYKDFAETRRAIDASGAEMVTVAVRRVNITDPGKENLLDHVPPEKFVILPNTAGCYTADEAIRTARLAREAGVGKGVGEIDEDRRRLGDERAVMPDRGHLAHRIDRQIVRLQLVAGLEIEPRQLVGGAKLLEQKARHRGARGLGVIERHQVRHRRLLSHHASAGRMNRSVSPGLAPAAVSIA